MDTAARVVECTSLCKRAWIGDGGDPPGRQDGAAAFAIVRSFFGNEELSVGTGGCLMGFF